MNEIDHIVPYITPTDVIKCIDAQIARIKYDQEADNLWNRSDPTRMTMRRIMIRRLEELERTILHMAVAKQEAYEAAQRKKS